MPDMEKIQKIQEQRQLNTALLSLSKSATTAGEEIAALLAEGADAHVSGSQAFLNACKRFNFEAVKTLIDFGALSKPIARKYLGSVCDYRGFDKLEEEDFFGLLDYAIGKTGNDDFYFEPYINYAAATGDLARLKNFAKRFSLSPEAAAQKVYVRIIFEIIKNGHMPMLEFVSAHKEWMDQTAFDSAVAGGEEEVLAYLIDNSELYCPSSQAAATALFAARTGVLDMLSDIGYDFEERSSFFLEKACRAFMTVGAQPLEYLLRHGYNLTDAYKGNSIYENAVKDRNTKLIEYLNAEEKK